MQQFQPLCLQLDNEQIEAGQIAGRSREVADKTQSSRVFSDQKDHRNRSGGRLGRERRCRPAGRKDHGGLLADQVGRHLW
jgi:hypothetical protein